MVDAEWGTVAPTNIRITPHFYGDADRLSRIERRDTVGTLLIITREYANTNGAWVAIKDERRLYD